jgi:hypothetical protein
MCTDNLTRSVALEGREEDSENASSGASDPDKSSGSDGGGGVCNRMLKLKKRTILKLETIH